MTYKDIKSQYIIGKIKERSFSNEKDRRYINELCFLEKSITEGIPGLGGNIELDLLKHLHREEYEIIYKELDPKEFKRYLKTDKEERLLSARIRKTWEKKRKKKLEEDEKDWISLGGLG